VSRLFIKLGEGIYQEMDKAKDLTKLIKKHVVDKNGRVTTVWVKMAFDNSANIFKKYSQIGFSERYNEIKETSKKEFKDLIDSGFLTLEKAHSQHQHLLLTKLLEDVELNKIFHIQYNVIERKDEK
jgi:hypothetical protein